MMIDGVLLGVGVVLAIPAFVLLLQVALASWSRSAPASSAAEKGRARPAVAVLVPAHDEAAGIASTLATIAPQLGPGDRLLVVADNCTDATAAIAREAGAEVVERNDLRRRGKGYALDFGVRALESQPPGVVVIIDADCTLEPFALDRLASRCTSTGRPVQALYLMRASTDAGLRSRIAEFAWVVRNHVRPLGFLRWGLPCQLMGTGMAFPWELIRTAPLASGHLVEDMQLGLDLAVAGASPLFCPEAGVGSTFPQDAEGTATQRTRWEHGHLSVIGAAAPRLLWQAALQGRADLLALALDLCVPPLAALVILTTILALLCVVAWLLGGSAAPLAVVMVALAAIGIAVVVARNTFARQIVSVGDLLAVPAYVFGKLPVYARLLRRRQVAWIRTKRDGGRD